MTSCPLPMLRRRSTFGSIVALAFSVMAAPAFAQGHLDARYAVTLAGLSLGTAAWTVQIEGERFATSASGRASGLMSVLFDGAVSAQSRGGLAFGHPIAALYTARNVSDSERSQTVMRIENGAVSDLQVTGAPTFPDTVPLTPADRHGVVDPLTAMLAPITGAYDVLSAETCRRTLAVFDGRRRYDLRLSFKRMEQVKATAGYSGPAIVCGVAFQAHAGHRSGSLLVRYLSDGPDMELWLAPIAGTRVAAPFRASVSGVLGALVVQATQFHTNARPTLSAQSVGRAP